MKLTTHDTNVHIGELLNVFNDIDTRISELHLNSSQVFLQLNDFLKDYYKKNTIISTNAAQIFDTISGNNEACLTCELNEIFKEFENYKRETDNEFDSNISINTQLNNKINYLSLLLRNLKQDLTTLKFLTTNFKIISDNDISKNVTTQSVQKWERIIFDIHPWVSEIGKEIVNLSQKFGELHKNTKSYLQNSVNKNFSLNEELKSAIALVNKKNLESKNYIPVLKEKINSSSVCIGNIITHLQYHDIIRQKVEHIQHSHLKIIASLKDDFNNQDDKKVREDDKIISLIADISGLQAAQLILTTVSTISHEFSFEGNNSDTTLIRLVKERLDKSLQLMDEYNSNSFNNEVVTIKKQISDIYNNASNNIIIPIESTEFFNIILEGANEEKRKSLEGKPSIIGQIASLAGDIIEKKNDLRNELLNVVKLSEKFSIEDDLDGFRSKLEKEQIRIMVSISKTLDRLDEESKQLDSVLLQNCSIKKDIIDRLKETLNQADYYELFEKVLNIIIEQLNAMNNRLRIEGGQNDKSNKVNNLKEIEAYYTVASERIIHQKVINDDKEMDLPPDQKTEEDLELF
jgi:hypothetical protein